MFKDVFLTCNNAFDDYKTICKEKYNAIKSIEEKYNLLNKFKGTLFSIQSILEKLSCIGELKEIDEFNKNINLKKYMKINMKNVINIHRFVMMITYLKYILVLNYLF